MPDLGLDAIEPHPDEVLREDEMSDRHYCASAPNEEHDWRYEGDNFPGTSVTGCWVCCHCDDYDDSRLPPDPADDRD